MKYIYGRQDFKTFERGEENCYLMTNGLGGWSSMTIIGSCSRNDHAFFMACKREESPNHRINVIHRLKETLWIGEKSYTISSQDYTDKENREEGYLLLSSFTYENYPSWLYEVEGVRIIKKIVMKPDENTVGVSYEILNESSEKARLEVIPMMEFLPKGWLMEENQSFSHDADECCVSSRDVKLYYKTNGNVVLLPETRDNELYYAYDECDGRREIGITVYNHKVVYEVEADCAEDGLSIEGTLDIIYSLSKVNCDIKDIEDSLIAHRERLLKQASLKDETAKALVVAADQFVSYRASTGMETILAGFPFFEDWGRDTMISLRGICLSTGRYEMAKNILRTFMKNVRKGLMPNLFPEGKNQPMYNTVDAALLYIVTVYELYKRTEDIDFINEAWPVMVSIIANYIKGTDYSIKLDSDGLITAGAGIDLVTWMDARCGDVTPTSRHGKPVEINAYWYNCLTIMDIFKKELGKSDDDCHEIDFVKLAKDCRDSFNAKFWNDKEECLIDYIGLKSEPLKEYQIRCNQIWAVSLPFSILDREREKKVVRAVYKKLYTPYGLRSLATSDAEFHPNYGGQLLDRDLAYHQGTVWTFPLGGYYLAYLKVNDYSDKAKNRVRMSLESINGTLREGCIGQIAEIYDGLRPVSSRGCFAQAWSVGEILMVYDALEGNYGF